MLFHTRKCARFARDALAYDVAVVGAGPAGLSCAIRLKQLKPTMSVCVLEKGSNIGSHILSGNVFEPKGLDELFPSWKSDESCPVKSRVSKDDFHVLISKSSSFRVPPILLPSDLHNESNYVISLSKFVAWLGSKATELGIDIFPGFPVASALIEGGDRVAGVRIADSGISKTGQQLATHQLGPDVKAKCTVVAEGCRGSVAENLIKRFDLRKSSISPPTYGLGLKEVWKVDDVANQLGIPQGSAHVTHSIGWPLGFGNYSGSFLYADSSDNLVHVGTVVGLDYADPRINPYNTFQWTKSHPVYSRILSMGKRIEYGARTITVGGWQSLPSSLSFPGGLIIGDSAGVLNLPKIKGTHTSMKSGMIAADCISKALDTNASEPDFKEYDSALRSSWVGDELRAVRNCKPMFKRGGMLGGSIYTGLVYRALKGREPFTLTWLKSDSENTSKFVPGKQVDLSEQVPPPVPASESLNSFPLLDNLAFSGTNHNHDQPSHLAVRPSKTDVASGRSFTEFGAPESRFCPAGVYEYVLDTSQPQASSSTEGSAAQQSSGSSGANTPRLQINAQNCVHCKACDIKCPENFIEWTVPESGGGGPNYTST